MYHTGQAPYWAPSFCYAIVLFRAMVFWIYIRIMFFCILIKIFYHRYNLTLDSSNIRPRQVHHNFTKCYYSEIRFEHAIALNPTQVNGSVQVKEWPRPTCFSWAAPYCSDIPSQLHRERLSPLPEIPRNIYSVCQSTWNCLFAKGTRAGALNKLFAGWEWQIYCSLVSVIPVT